MFQFGAPEVLSYFVALPVFVLLVLFLHRRAKKRVYAVFGNRLAPFLSASVSETRRRVKLVLQLLALSLFILALARPQFGDSVQDIKSAGVELLLLIDVSTSMLAEDVRPNRLEFAKLELKRLLDQSRGNRVGLVAFAGSAALVSPMTTDRSALNMFIDSLSTETVSSQGTDFQSALAEAADAFKRGGTQEDGFTRATQAIIVASDGEDHEAGAIEKAKELSADGIRIFSLAFGTEKGAPIPIRDRNNYLRGHMKDDAGKTILTSTTGVALKELASVGGGSFYHASFGGNYIRKLAEDIDKLEKADMESSQVTLYDERYQPVLFLGILIALLDLLISERRRGFRLWKGRFEVPPA